MLCYGYLNWLRVYFLIGNLPYIIKVSLILRCVIPVVLSNNKNKLMVHMYIVTNTTIFLIFQNMQETVDTRP